MDLQKQIHGVECDFEIFSVENSTNFKYKIWVNVTLRTQS